MKPAMHVSVMLLCCALSLVASTLTVEQLKAEPDLEKRAGQCWKAADQSLNTARKFYQDGKASESFEQLALSMEIVELGYSSLQETGKNPRRSSKHFKRAEQNIRKLAKKMRAVLDGMSFEDREKFAAYPKRLDELHTILLRGIFGLK